MKMTSKKIRVSIILCLTLVMTSTSPTMAIDGTNSDSETKNRTTASCTVMANLKTNKESAISTQMATMQSDFSSRLKNVRNREAQLLQSVTAKRNEIKERFEVKIRQLESQSGLTDTQRQAIETFKTEVETAVTTRETAVDKARSDYLSDLADIVTNHQKALAAATIDYQAAVHVALTTAVENCGQEGNLTTLRASIKTVRGKFEEARSSTAIKNQIAALAQTRADAIQAANTAFKTEINDYKTTLKEALQSTGTTNAVNTNKKNDNKAQALASLAVKVAEVYYADSGMYPKTTTAFMTGYDTDGYTPTAKMPDGSSVITPSSINASNGTTSVGYYCSPACDDTITGGKITFWDFTTNAVSTKAYYIGTATSASTFTPAS